MRLVGRRIAVTAAIGAVLAAAAVVVVARPAAVAGDPSATATVGPPERSLINVAPVPLPKTTMPTPPPVSTPPATPPPAQPENTVRLAHGGTATLVPQEVVDGVLPVPEGVREAAWWGAAFNGPTGATVLAGHVNWHGETGPFAELWQAEVGDPVSIVDDHGDAYAYHVREVVTVHKSDLPARAQELFGQDGAHRLVLVTCGGRWVGGHDGYEENRVVIAG